MACMIKRVFTILCQHRCKSIEEKVVSPAPQTQISNPLNQVKTNGKDSASSLPYESFHRDLASFTMKLSVAGMFLSAISVNKIFISHVLPWSASGFIFALILYPRRPYSDLNKVSVYKKKFKSESLEASIKYHGWNNILKVATLNELKEKFAAEVQDKDFLQTIHLYSESLMKELYASAVIDQADIIKKLKAFAESDSEPKVLIATMVKDRSLIEAFGIKKDVLADAISMKKSIHTLSFQDLIDADGLSLYGEVLTDAIVRPRFHEFIYNDNYDAERFFDHYRAQFAKLYEKDLSYAVELSYVFSQILQSLPLTDIHDKYYPDPISKYGKQLVGDDTLYNQLITLFQSLETCRTTYNTKISQMKTDFQATQLKKKKEFNSVVRKAQQQRDRALTDILYGDLTLQDNVMKKYLELVSQVQCHYEQSALDTKYHFESTLQQTEEESKQKINEINNQWNVCLESSNKKHSNAQFYESAPLIFSLRNSSSSLSSSAPLPAPSPVTKLPSFTQDAMDYVSQLPPSFNK